MWPVKPKLFTKWPFIESLLTVCQLSNTVTEA